MLGVDLNKRVYGLDILRTIGVLSVLINHFDEYLPQMVRDLFFPVVTYGVPYFFVLSGFLIGGILIKKLNSENFRVKNLFSFWCNRWIRTIPPYYFAMTILLLGTYFFNKNYFPSHLTDWQLTRFYLFLQNATSPRMSFYVESWSLSVEEWFYLITPALIFILIRLFKLDIRRSILLTIIVLISAVIIGRVYKYSIGLPYDEYLTVNRLDSLMFGVLGAYFLYYHKEWWDKMRYKLFYIGILLFILITVKAQYIDGIKWYADSYFRDIYLSIIKDTFIPLMIFFFLAFLNSIKTGKGFIYKFISYTSLISYSLYLLHYTPIKYCIVETIHRNNLPMSDTTRFILCFGLSYIFATLMFLFIEKPCMDVRKKIKFLQK